MIKLWSLKMNTLKSTLLACWLAHGTLVLMLCVLLKIISTLFWLWQLFLVFNSGNTLKNIEKECCAKIMIRGKGSVKEGKVGRKDGQMLPGEDEPLHALVTANTMENVKKAVEQVRWLQWPYSLCVFALYIFCELMVKLLCTDSQHLEARHWNARGSEWPQKNAATGIGQT